MNSVSCSERVGRSSKTSWLLHLSIRRQCLPLGGKKFAKEVWCLNVCAKGGDIRAEHETCSRSVCPPHQGLQYRKLSLGVCVWVAYPPNLHYLKVLPVCLFHKCMCMFVCLRAYVFKNECICYFSLPPKSSSQSPTWFIQDSYCFGSHFNGCTPFAFSICMSMYRCQIASKIPTIISSWRSASEN